ncbi:MAG: glycosyltransferase [Culturomica sp.]|jgi:glycosyltransferase involved in cell wall biosynthesis|nr:glycosyltransferase [Culturomica sp.]
MACFSIIVPVYNRPDEIKELLESLSVQSCKDFEVLIMEDASSLKCDRVVEEYRDRLDIRYYFEPGTGRSQRRNLGMERAKGDYFVFFDSDCIIPEAYFTIVTKRLEQAYADCYGGPDNAHASFSDFQKAVNYSMTSFLTTGGIRGGKEGLDKFHPRTFNMGFSREVYQKTGGFRDMFGEDVDLSLRIREAGFTVKLFKDAFVYHKRRVTFKSFYKQVKVFGMARIDLYLEHPDSLKWVHCLPAFFVVGTVLLLLASLFSRWALLPLGLFVLTVLTESAVKNRNFRVVCLSIFVSFTQLFGYGIGFLEYFFKKIVFARKVDREKELKKHY